MEIEEQFTHPTYEIDFENDEAFHEPEYEASHDVKENEEFHFVHDDDEEMQDTNIKNELDMVVEEDEHHHEHEESSTDDEDENTGASNSHWIQRNTFEKMDIHSMNRFLLKWCDYLMRYQGNLTNEQHFVKQFVFDPQNNWEMDMNDNRIIFQTSIQKPFFCNIALLLCQLAYNQNTNDFDSIRKTICIEILDFKNEVPSYQQKYEDLDTDVIYSLDDFMEIPIRQFIYLLFDTEQFFESDYFTFQQMDNHFISISTQNQEPIKFSCDNCKIITLESISMRIQALCS